MLEITQVARDVSGIQGKGFQLAPTESLSHLTWPFCRKDIGTFTPCTPGTRLGVPDLQSHVPKCLTPERQLLVRYFAGTYKLLTNKHLFLNPEASEPRLVPPCAIRNHLCSDKDENIAIMERMEKRQVQFLKSKCLLIPFGNWLLSTTAEERKIPLVFLPFKVPLYHSCGVSREAGAGVPHRRHFKDGISCRNEAVWSRGMMLRLAF